MHYARLKAMLKKQYFIRKFYLYLKYALAYISPLIATKFIFLVSKGAIFNPANPVTFDDKVSWLKLYVYSNNPLVTECADKYRVREYIKERGCEETLNELYGVYDSVDDIRWNELPESFVLKWNMGCGCNIICKNKQTLDIQKTIDALKKWENFKYHLVNAEMQYKNIKKKLICEKFLEDDNGGLPLDYKFYCFHGQAKYVLICSGREYGHPYYSFFDREWKPIKVLKEDLCAPISLSTAKPDGIDKAFKYASLLSKPFPFVRSDFYLIHGKPIFGELTFTPAGGIDSEYLESGQYFLGDLIDLSAYKKK